MSDLEQYSQHRFNSTPSELDILMENAPLDRGEGVKAVGQAMESLEEDKGILERAGDVAGDIVKGVTLEAPKQVVGGVADSFNELMQFADEAGEGIEEAIGIDIPVLQVFNEEGEFDLDLIKRTEDFKTLEVPTTEAADTVTGNLVRGVSQFLAPFGALNKAMKTAQTTNKIVKGGKIVTSGAIVDAAFFEPMEENLSNLVQEFPALQL